MTLRTDRKIKSVAETAEWIIGVALPRKLFVGREGGCHTEDRKSNRERTLTNFILTWRMSADSVMPGHFHEFDRRTIRVPDIDNPLSSIGTCRQRLWLPRGLPARSGNGP